MASGSGGGMSAMPWGDILKIVDMGAMGREASEKGNKNLQDALGGGSNNGFMQPGSSRSGSAGAADKLLDLLGKAGGKESDQSDDIQRMLAENQAEIDKLGLYGGQDFGSKQLPKKNYGLRLSDDSSYGL